MTSRIKKAGYTTMAGLGILAGAAGIAAAATGGSTSPAQDRPATVQPAPDASQAAQADDANEQSPAYTGSVTAPEQDGVSETDEAQALASLATITPDEASAAATAAVPGTAAKVELDNENGSVVYSVEVQTANGVVDVKVDAGDGTVLAQETGEDDANEDEAGEDDTDDVEDQTGEQNDSSPAASN